MKSIRYTLLADGTSDRRLCPVIDCVIEQIVGRGCLEAIPQVADLRRLKIPLKDLRRRISITLRYYPCDVLFVHRDAEREPREKRVQEIAAAVSSSPSTRNVPLIPVRMTEAWLLIDEQAIRTAAGNPRGILRLDMPPVDRLERLSDPKSMLRSLLARASEKTGRRLDRFKNDIGFRVQRVADYIADFSTLRRLSAFQSFEEDTRTALRSLGIQE